MTDHRTVEDFIPLTVWVMRNGKHGYKAVRCNGQVLATHRHKSTLVHTLQQMAAHRENNIYAIAEVVYPDDRQPNKRLIKTRSMEK